MHRRAARALRRLRQRLLLKFGHLGLGNARIRCTGQASHAGLKFLDFQPELIEVLSDGLKQDKHRAMRKKITGLQVGA